jgi:hypothetical protein
MVEQDVEYMFPYGIKPNTVYLKIKHIGWQCPECCVIMTDERGEDAREKAVKIYLER